MIFGNEGVREDVKIKNNRSLDTCLFLTIVLLGYPIIICTFHLDLARTIIRVCLCIGTVFTAIGLVWLLISRIIKAIKSITKRGDER